MKIVKFLGKLLSLPFGVAIFITLIALAPIKLINNWLSGYGKYNSLYWKFTKYCFGKLWDRIKVGDKPTLIAKLTYKDQEEVVEFINDRKSPAIIHTSALWEK